ncbi:hypothetical protein JCM8097_001090 [Rhodosporidiobolus ruineniae]
MKPVSLVQALVATVSSAVAVASSSPIMAQYWPAYNADVQAASAVNFEYADIAYYFVTVTTATGFEVPEGQSTADIATFVSSAKAAGSKPVFSVGGWSGSRYFSTLTDTAEKRSTLANSLKAFMDQYGFVGIDFDWEYPNSQGLGCNAISPNDSANFLSLLQTVRSLVGSSGILTAAVSTSGLMGPDGTALSDFSDFATYLDYINLMTYDVSGSWSPTTGPNSPLRRCKSDTSVETAVKLWTSRGFPAEKILLGIPSYAVSFTTTSSTLSPVSIKGGHWTSYLYQDWTKVTPQGAPGDSNAPGTDECGNSYTGSYSGQWQYNQLIENGLLTANGTAGASGYTRRYDACAQTPFLFNDQTRTLIAYDDAQSASAKAAWAKTNGLAGVMIFDSTGFDASVLSSIRSSLLSRKTRRHQIYDLHRSTA